MAPAPDLDAAAFVVSSGVQLCPFGDGAVVVDLLGGTAHRVSAAAAVLLAHEGPTRVEDLAAAASAETGGDVAAWAAWIDDAVADLRSVGLLDRTEPYVTPPPPGGSTCARPGRYLGRVHAVLDHGIAFRSDDRDLLDLLDRFLGTGLDDRAATLVFDAHPTPTDGVDLWTEGLWAFPTVDGFFSQLPAVLNDYVARTHGLLVLHSGGVRTPDGRVVLLSGPVDSGKSTLTAALVAAGCDYLGDESIGIRSDLSAVAYAKPFTLDPSGRAVLGVPRGPSPHVAVAAVRADARVVAGSAGPVAEVLLVRYDPSAAAVARRPLDALGALEALFANTLNLARSGEEGLAALCDLAERVPVAELVHPGVDAAVPVVLGGGAGPAGDSSGP